MSWTREELKDKAKRAFYKNYWVCILITFLLGFAGGNGGISCSFNTGNRVYKDNYDYNYSHEDDYYVEYNNDYIHAPGTIVTTMGGIAVFIVLIITILTSLMNIFVYQPIQVGGCHFFLENAIAQDVGISTLLTGFKTNYKGVVLTMFLRQLYTFLWTLLFIVPGIVKSYEYRMIPYIMADYPEISYQEAFALSRKMMDGEKWNAFVLDLSFLGWSLLSLCTFGLLNIFYVNPYRNATNAELYLNLKHNK